jgi:hypothetical protein
VLEGRNQIEFDAMTMNDLTTIAQDFLTECREDYVGLWSLVARIRRAGAADDSNIRKTTLDLVTPPLSEKRIVAGQFVPEGKRHPGQSLDKNGFETWQMRREDVIAKIESEWKELGRDPILGEIVWFTAALVED